MSRFPPEWQGLEAVRALEAWVAEPPTVFIVLGSGLASLASRVPGPIDLPFSRVAGIPPPTTSGHSGRFVSGRMGDTPVLVQVGRLHLYEGHSPTEVALPMQVAAALGARLAIVTNAAGSLRSDLAAGTIALIRDYLDLQRRSSTSSSSGTGPLSGTSRRRGKTFAAEGWAVRTAEESALELGMPLGSGVYAGVLGPSYETRSEVRMLRSLGADLVGMSTVQEVRAARDVELPTLGLSLITNFATGLTSDGLSHQDVLRTAAVGSDALERLVRHVVGRVADLPPTS